MPTVIKGFYGDILTKENISLEHLKPHSEGGVTALKNLVLASRQKNFERGTKPLAEAINEEAAVEYFKQFLKIKTKHFDGPKYVRKATEEIEKLGVKLNIIA